jgi:GxxExxY protein
LAHKLEKTQLTHKEQERVDVHCDGIIVREHFAGIVVENFALVELESRKQLIYKDETRLLKYLKPAECEVSLLLSFGIKPEIKRKAFGSYR